VPDGFFALKTSGKWEAEISATPSSYFVPQRQVPIKTFVECYTLTSSVLMTHDVIIQ